MTLCILVSELMIWGRALKQMMLESLIENPYLFLAISNHPPGTYDFYFFEST